MIEFVLNSDSGPESRFGLKVQILVQILVQSQGSDSGSDRIDP